MRGVAKHTDMEPFVRLEGVAAPMFRDGIDTDAIIPVSRMKALDADYGEGLFANLRYRADGSEDPEFVLNRPAYRHASILVAGANFGCGSSREQAVWALLKFGIRCVIAGGFGDIFHGNCFRAGLLPVALPLDSCRDLARAAAGAPGSTMTVDLAACRVIAPGGGEHVFEIDALRRRRLLEGLDELGATLLLAGEIAAFQARDRLRRPWIHELSETP